MKQKGKENGKNNHQSKKKKGDRKNKLKANKSEAGDAT